MFYFLQIGGSLLVKSGYRQSVNFPPNQGEVLGGGETYYDKTVAFCELIASSLANPEMEFKNILENVTICSKIGRVLYWVNAKIQTFYRSWSSGFESFGRLRRVETCPPSKGWTAHRSRDALYMTSSQRYSRYQWSPEFCSRHSLPACVGFRGDGRIMVYL